MATTRTRRSRSGARSSRTADPTEGRLDRDYSDEEYREPGEGYNGPQPAKGLYPAKLVDLRDHTSGEGNESVRWGFELTDGETDGESIAGFRDYQYTNDSTTLWREQQIAVALGLCKPNGRLKGTYSALLKKAKPCTVRIIRERYIPEDGEPEWRAKIAAVLTARDTKPSRRGRDDDDEDYDEDEPDEEVVDDEEEERPARRSRSRSKSDPEPEPEDEEEYDPDELAAELEDMTLVALKKRAREEFGVKITRGMKSEDIIDAILETLDEDQETDDEPEDEPEPSKRRGARKTTSARSGSKRRSRNDDDNEPPF